VRYPIFNNALIILLSQNRFVRDDELVQLKIFMRDDEPTAPGLKPEEHKSFLSHY